MVGGYHMNFSLMLWGRIVFGMGCEAMIVGQSAITSAWFINYELPFAMSMIICLPLFGSFIQGAFIPSIYETSGFGAAFGIGFILCLISLLLVIILAFIDYFTQIKDAKILDDYVDTIK